MAETEPKPAAPRSMQEWVDVIAVAGLVAGGLLVSVCAPLLRKRNEALRAELAELAGPPAAALGELVDDQAADPAAYGGNGAAPVGAELAGDVP